MHFHFQYDVLETVLPENIEFIPHGTVRDEYQMKTIEKLLRMSFLVMAITIVFRHRQSGEAGCFSFPIM